MVNSLFLGVSGGCHQLQQSLGVGGPPQYLASKENSMDSGHGSHCSS